MTQNFLYIYEKNCHHQFFLLKIEFNVALQFLFNVVILRVATWSGKTKKNDKSQVKMGVFEKSQDFFFLISDVSVQIYQIPYI